MVPCRPTCRLRPHLEHLHSLLNGSPLVLVQAGLASAFDGAQRGEDAELRVDDFRLGPALSEEGAQSLSAERLGARVQQLGVCTCAYCD